MARAVTTRHQTVVTIAAWLVALLIFFPILWTILTELQDRARRHSRCRRIPVLPLDDRELRRGAGALGLLQARP